MASLIDSKVVKRGKLEFRIRYVSDEINETWQAIEHLGEFTNEIGEYVFDRAEGRLLGKWDEDAQDYEILLKDLGATRLNREYYYFKPTNHLPHNPRNWEHVDKKTQNKELKKFGVKTLAEVDMHYAYQDWLRAERFNKDWEFMCIEVKLYVDGVETTFASIAGVESDAGEDHTSQLQNELMEQCVDNLREWYGMQTTRMAKVEAALEQLEVAAQKGES